MKRQPFLKQTISIPKPRPAWIAFIAGCLIVALTATLFPPSRVNYAEGAYSTSTTDADGNTHLASNTVNDTNFYDRTQDSSSSTLQQLGTDPNWANGVVRNSHALKFDGSNDYVTIADSTSLSPGTGDHTVEGWFKTSSSGVQGWLYSNYGSTSNNTVSAFINTSNGVTCSYRDGSGNTASASSGVTVNDNTWHAFACVKQDKTALIYLDGVRKNTTSNTSLGTITTTGRAKTLGTLATSPGVSELFTGYIDEIRVSTTARYTEAAYSPPRRLTEDSNTAALYHFDEGTSTTLADATQKGNDGTLMNGSSNSPAADGTANGPIWASGSNAIMDGFVGCSPDAATPDARCTNGGRTGAGNLTLGPTSSTTNDKAYDVRITGSNGLSFDGTDDYASNASLSTSLAADFTIETWLKHSTTAPVTTNDYLFDLARTGGVGTRIRMNASSCVLAFENGSGPTNAVGGSLSVCDNSWHHVAAVRTGTTYNLYQDGILVATTPGTLQTYTGLYVGWSSNATANAAYTGSLDELRLTSGVRYIGNFTPPRRFATDATTVGLWHLDDGSGATSTDLSGNSNTLTFMNGTGNSPVADGTTNGPLWVEGIAASADAKTQGTDPGSANANSSSNWALPGYAFRKRVNIATTTATGVGYGVETTTDRGTIMDNKQTRPDGNDWRVQYQPGDRYRSLSFDGSNDYTNFAANSNLNLTTAGTVSLWVKLGSYSTSTIVTLLNIGNFNSSRDGYRIYHPTGTSVNTIRFQISSASASNQVDATNVPIGIWTNLTMTWNGSNLVGYVNGTQSGSTSQTLTASPSGALTLGNSSGSAMNGSLDNIQLYSSALGSSQVSALYNGGAGNSSALTTNLAAWWKLDEGSGQIIRDYSGNDINGTLGADSSSASDDPTWLTGATADGAVSTIQEVPRFIPHGHSLSFNGTSTSLSNAALASSLTGDFTAETWFKSTTNGRLLETATAGGIGLDSYIQTGQVCFSSNGGVSAIVCSTGSTYANGAWHHLAFTRQGLNLRFYLDGILAGSATLSSVGTFTRVFAGALTGSSNWFSGQLDEVRISNTVRYRNNFTSSANPFAKDGSTMLLWHLDDGSGSTAADSSGNSSTGTIANGTWVTNGGKIDSINQTQFKTIAPIGASSTDKDYYLYYGNLNEGGAAQSYNSYALKLDGSTSSAYVVTASSPLNPSATDFTATAWVNSNSAATQTILGQENGSGTGQAWLSISSGKLTTSITGSVLTAATTMSTNTWYFVALTKSGSNITLYVNGSSDLATTGTTISMSGSLRFGTNKSSGNQLSGQLDDVRVYSRQLSGTEVTALYSNTPTVSNSSLVGWWKLNNSGGAASTTATDYSGSSNTGTLTSFGFNSTGNWVVNKNLLAVTTEPTQTILTTIQETPTFFQYRQAPAGTWSTRAQITPTETQLGSEGVYLRFNPEGLYSRQDYYQIPSWAVEAFSTSAPQRGKRRSFPVHANIISEGTSGAGGITVIDADTNKVWMRFASGTNNIIPAAALRNVTMLNGRIYYTTSSGLVEIDLTTDTAHFYSASGNSYYGGTIADRNDALAYGTASGTALGGSSVTDVSPMVLGNSPPKFYIGVATAAAGLNLIDGVTAYGANELSAGSLRTYAQIAGDSYGDVVLTTGGELYGTNLSRGSLNRYNDVNNDSGDQTGSVDVSYTTASTPPLQSGSSLSDLSVTVGTSTADLGTSNKVAVTSAVGVDLIDEHSTQSSGIVRHFIRQGTVGASGWSNRNFSSVLSFDGSNDLVGVTATGINTTAATSVTVEFWINSNTTQSASPIIFGSNNNYTLIINGTCFGFNTGNSDCYGVNTSALSSGVWHHIAAVFVNASPSSNTLYIDGVQQSLSQLVGTPISSRVMTTTLRFGGASASNYWRGLMDDIRVTNGVRYTSNFTPPVTALSTDTNTVGLWHLDERSGQTVIDVSGNSTNGTLGASSSVASDDPVRVIPALAGTADVAKAVGLPKATDSAGYLTFDGSNDVASTAYTWTGVTNFTMSAWVKFTALPTIGVYFNVVTGDGREGIFIHPSGKAVLRSFDATEHITPGVTAINDGNWHFVAATYDSAAPMARLYVDGVQEATLSNYPTFVGGASFNKVWLGENATTSIDTFYNGSIDDVRVYQSTLSPTQVGQLYNSGSGTVLPIDSSQTLWWQFNEGTGTTVTDSSGAGHTLAFGASTAAPTWATGGIVRNRSGLWVGTSDGAGGGALTDISLDTDKQITAWTTSNSGLPENDINSLSLGLGGLALVGTNSAGAWAPGLAGFVVDDTAATPATVNSPVRVKSGGTTRIRSGGTVRIRSGP